MALTFDDGPHPVWTPKILDELRAARVRAIFCVIGSQVTKYPELVARIARDGHTLCNHSWNHNRQLGACSLATIGRTSRGPPRRLRKPLLGRVSASSAPAIIRHLKARYGITRLA